MNPPTAKPDRTLLVILGVIVVLVVVALVVVFSRGTPAPLDEDTPEGVVQRYTSAVLERDTATAGRYVTDAAYLDCAEGGRQSVGNIRMTLVSTTEREESAYVTVSMVTTYESGPFGVSDYEAEGVFDLIKEDGAWLITSAPWELTLCSPDSGSTKDSQ